MAATLRWIRWALALSLVAVVVLTLAVLVSLGLAARSETGSARLLSWVSGLQVVQPSGSIWGDFHALRIEWRGANGSRVTLVEPRWTGLTVSSAPQTAWRLAIVMDRLEARRVDVQWVSKPSAVAKGPPTSLTLPVAIKIGALSVERFQSNWTGAEALGSVRGSLALQQAGALSGTPEHRVTLSQLSWQGWHLSGEGRVQVQGSMAVQAHVQAASALDEGDLSVSGPLRRLAVQGQVQVKARDSLTTTTSPQRGSQSLTVAGVVAPFEAWPVPSAQVRSRQFDAQRLVASWPSTALSGDIDIKPRDTLAGAPGTRMQAIGKAAPAITAASDLLVHADLRNDVSGLWDAGRVPVVRLQADLVLPGQASTHTLAGLGRDGIMSARLTLPALGGRESGTVGVEGRWSLDRWQDTALRATLQHVELLALHSGAPALSLEGPVQVQGQPDRSWLITGDLQGRDGARKALAVPVQAQWSARWQPGLTTLNALVLNAGGAQAKASGRWLVADGGAWQIEGDLALKGFDPAVWLPWPRPSGDALQGTRLDGQTQWKLAVATPGQWLGIQGQARVC
jgi:translocation and assembly module TamB